MLAVTDEGGNVLASVVRQGTPRPRSNLFDLPAVRHALIADTITADSSFGVLTQAAGEASIPLQVGCVAIMVGGYPVGVLVLGQRIDRLLPGFTAARGTHAVVTAGEAVLLSTTKAASAGGKWTHTPGRDPTWRIQLGDDEYVGTSLPIGLADNGTPARMHLMRSLSASVVPITNAMRRSFLLFGILAVLVA